MTDITDRMNDYREACRSLWNIHFAKKNRWELTTPFNQIQRLLFDALVTDGLSYEGEAEGVDIPPPALRVVPRSRAELLVAEADEPHRGTVWSRPKDVLVQAGGITLEFLEYFDWEHLRTREFQYLLCRILGFPDHPEFEGRRALIEAWRCSVFHDEESDDALHVAV
jgi:hypothetical protein